jgi:hypothetical protein
MTCGIALTESVTSLGKCTKLQLNNEQGWLRSALFFVAEKIFQLFFKNPLTKWLRCGIIVAQTETRKEHKSEQKGKDSYQPFHRDLRKGQGNGRHTWHTV